jgi:predicted  nucleic acid-binding Zn-ribbon protein
VLEKQVASLTKAKNAALEDARSARTKVDTLNDKLKAQTQQMMDLQDQIKTIRTVLEQLQQKLE